MLPLIFSHHSLQHSILFLMVLVTSLGFWAKVQASPTIFNGSCGVLGWRLTFLESMYELSLYQAVASHFSDSSRDGKSV